MTSHRISRKAKILGLPLGLAGVAAAALLAGGSLSSTAVAKSSPDETMAEASKFLAKGKFDKAIELAESAVAGNPQEPSYRAILGQAYFKAGRFDSAAATFNDAMKLGDNSALTALGLALSNVAIGRNSEAVAILDDWREAIPGTDLGLALALAGEPARGVAVLADQLRAGDNSAKVRQNLAYAYALDGRWREARLMAAQDIPANQLDRRLSEWAANAQPEAAKARVASLIRAPLRDDPGQPRALALGDSAAREQLAVEAAAVTTVAATSELPATAPIAVPAVAAATPVPAENPYALANYAPVSSPEAATPVQAIAAEPAVTQATFAQTFSAEPVTQPVAAPATMNAPARATRAGRVAISTKAPQRSAAFVRPAKSAITGSHAVQLGSFSSQQGARRAWGIFAAKNPELRKYRMQITQATVRGKQFWRVAAAGFDRGGASGLCSTVKTRGGVCFAYANNRFAPGGKGLTAPVLTAAKAPVQHIRVATAQIGGGARGAAARR